MRGKRQHFYLFGRVKRITPADAGKTNRLDNNILHIKDHPRGCGENGFPQCAWVSDSGSPPRMRGKLNNIASCYIKVKDHPRGCGENFVGNAVFVPTVRITPADAGKTVKTQQNFNAT